MHEFNIKNMLIDKLGDRVDKYNNSYHETIKMKINDRIN